MNIESNQEFEALCARLLPKFNEYLRLHSKNIFSCELATSLDGIKTMPALYDLNGVRKQVIAPLSLLTKDVDAEIAEAKKATAAANTAAGKANDAAASVTNATTDLTAERKKVEAAVNSSITQTAAAQKAAADTLASKAAIEENEVARQAAEQNRQTQETDRQKKETARVEAEKKRAAAESGRASAEAGRVKAESKRQTDTQSAIDAAKNQTSTAKELCEHPTKAGENGNWWMWNLQTHQYEDTGIIARGGAMYPSFRQRRNKLLMIDYGSHVAEHVSKKRNKLVFKV